LLHNQKIPSINTCGTLREKNWENRDGTLKGKKKIENKDGTLRGKKIGGRNYLPCNLHKNKTFYQNFTW
jgi:hypothetical protein